MKADDRKGNPIAGLEIIRGVRRAEGKDVWKGQILDPENGREYTARLTPIEGGKRLDVRGSIGPFGRTQPWVRGATKVVRPLPQRGRGPEKGETCTKIKASTLPAQPPMKGPRP